MKTIFWGLLITWLHFNLNFGAMQIELLPSALGWYYVLKGVNELPPCSARDAVEGPLKVLIGLSAVVWCMQLVGGLGILGGAVSLMETCVHVYVLYLLIELVAAVEMMLSSPLPVANLRLGWKIFTFCIVAGQILSLTVRFPSLHSVLVLFGSAIALCSFIVSVYLMVYWWRTAKAYEFAVAHPVEILPPEEE